MTPRRLVVFRGKSLYGYLNRFTEAMAAALAGFGDTIVTIDTEQPDHLATLQRALAAGPVDGFVGFVRNGLIRQAERNPYNILGRPLVSIYLDPLLNYWQDVVTPIKKRLVFSTAPDDPVFWPAAFKIETPVIRHLAHAATPLPAGEQPMPWEQRDIGILFSGTAPGDPAALRKSWLSHGPVVAKSLFRLLEAYDAEPGQSLGALIHRLEPGLAALASPEATSFHFSMIDNYLRARSRWQMASALMALPTVFVGPGWEAIADTRSEPIRATLMGAQDNAVVADLMRRTKLVASSCTPHHGTHERLFQAMAVGAVALTTETAWLRSNAPPGVLAQFRPGRDDPGEIAAGLLGDPATAGAIAEAGRRWFEEGYTWAHHAAAVRAAVAEMA
jgi:Glycosyl transferases group 1